MTATIDKMASEVVTLADCVMSPAATRPLAKEQATDALVAILATALIVPSHERDSERAQLVRAIREGRH